MSSLQNPLQPLSLGDAQCYVSPSILASLFATSSSPSKPLTLGWPRWLADAFGSLAQAPEVPWSHHLNSIIVCKITGKVLAGEDTAYALPNGNIYSGEGLEEIAKSGNGKITCPRSGNEFSWKDLKKVYIT